MRKVITANGITLDEGEWHMLGLGMVPFPEPTSLTASGGLTAGGHSSRVTPAQLAEIRRTRAYIKDRRERERLRRLVYGGDDAA